MNLSVSHINHLADYPLRSNAHHYLSQLSDKHTRMVVSLLSGGLAGATALFVSYPFDVARTRYV